VRALQRDPDLTLPGFGVVLIKDAAISGGCRRSVLRLVSMKERGVVKRIIPSRMESRATALLARDSRPSTTAARERQTAPCWFRLSARAGMCGRRCSNPCIASANPRGGADPNCAKEEGWSRGEMSATAKPGTAAARIGHLADYR